MDLKKQTNNFKISQRAACYSALIYSILSFFAVPSITIVPAICIAFSALNIDKTIVKNNIKLNLPFITVYNFLIPIMLTALLASIFYFKYFDNVEKEIPPISFILIFAPTIFVYTKILTKMIDFPTNIEMYGLEQKNYEIRLDFYNKRFYAKNDLLEIDSDLTIVGLGMTISELFDYQQQFESLFGKKLAECTVDELNVAKIYYYK